MSAPLPSPVPPHGGQLRHIAQRFNLPAEDLLDFSANINPLGPPPSVTAALQHALADPGTLTIYPDLGLADLKQTISTCEDLRPECIAAANGFVPLLYAALRSQKILRCLLPVPCFSEYRRTLEMCDATVIPYRLIPGGNFSYQPDSLLKALREHSCDSLLLANPQNPSGASCDFDRMRDLIARCSNQNIHVFLDEAFIDYCPAHSQTPRAAALPNLTVFRSVTKFFALPGLRVAYAVGNSSQIEAITRHLPPWPITTLAAHGVCAALQDHAYTTQSRSFNHIQRHWLTEHLVHLKISPYPSSTNFLLLRLPDHLDPDLLWHRMITEEHIVLRSCVNFEGLEPRHLRIAVRSGPENMRLINAFRRILQAT